MLLSYAINGRTKNGLTFFLTKSITKQKKIYQTTLISISSQLHNNVIKHNLKTPTQITVK